MKYSWRRIWLSVLGFWTTIGLVALSQDTASSVIDGRPALTAQTTLLTMYE